MNRLYHVTGYEKQSTRLVVTCRYAVAKECIVIPPGNSLEVYIDPFIERPPHYGVGPSFSGLNESNPSA